MKRISGIIVIIFAIILSLVLTVCDTPILDNVDILKEDNTNTEKDITPLSEITGFITTVKNKQITIYWSEPIESDFKEVMIFLTPEVNNIELPIIISKGNITTTITGLTNEIAYTFIIKTVDIKGNVSEGISSSPVIPTDKIIVTDVSITSSRHYKPGITVNLISEVTGTNVSQVTLWSIKGITPSGISINQVNGQLTISKDIPLGTGFTVCAKSANDESVFDTMYIIVTNITLTPEKIFFEKGVGGGQTFNVSVPGVTPAITWSIEDGEIAEITIDQNGNLMVGSVVAETSFTIKASDAITGFFDKATVEIREKRTFHISNLGEWAIAINTIQNGGNNKDYTLVISGTVGVPGISNNSTFGNVSGIIVTTKGNGKLYLTDQGSLFNIRDMQTLIIDDPNLILEGLRIGQNNSTKNNHSAVITLDGIGSGGGAKLELRNGTISGNRNENIYTGGGIDILGYHNFIISGGNISDNHGYIGGGIYENAGIITMTGGNIINNDAGIGGGIYITHGLFIMKDGNITENTAYTLANGLGGGGGGVYADGTFNMTGGTISKNSATGIYGDGGGVYAKSNFTMSGGAISGNTANNQYGGGVFLRQDSQIIVNFNKTGGIIYGNISNTNKNTANSNTNGHAVYFYNSTTYTNPGSYYRDTTLYIFDNIQTMDTIFPSSSGETLNGWTKK